MQDEELNLKECLPTAINEIHRRMTVSLENWLFPDVRFFFFSTKIFFSHQSLSFLFILLIRNLNKIEQIVIQNMIRIREISVIFNFKDVFDRSSELCHLLMNSEGASEMEQINKCGQSLLGHIKSLHDE